VKPFVSSFCLLASWFALGAAPLAAQEFRVFTRVYDVTRPGNPDTPISHSTTLFHAGRVYDYVGPAGELIVLDHANRRVTLLDTVRRVRTDVDFDEVNRLLKLSRRETLDLVDGLTREPGQAQPATVLRFYLDPKFDTVFDAERNELQLRSPHVVYRATCARLDEPARVEAYLRYADWAARLNHVLNPHAPYPAPRVALDEELRQRTLFPLEVTLELRTDTGERRYRAVHQTHWELNSTDRRKIHHWTTLLDDEVGTKRVTFLEYQRTVLTAKVR
jgi:hypothetical protein